MGKYSSRQYSNYIASHGVDYIKHLMNEDLSDAYWEVATCTFRKIKSVKDDPTYRMIKNKIARAEIDIEQFYLDHGNSLAELEIEGIGPKTKKILEDILRTDLATAKLIEFKRKNKPPFIKP